MAWACTRRSRVLDCKLRSVSGGTLAVDMASVIVCQGSVGLGGVLVAIVSLVLVESREGEADKVGVAVPGARLEG